jgi:probable rRNA maturation factor
MPLDPAAAAAVEVEVDGGDGGAPAAQAVAALARAVLAQLEVPPPCALGVSFVSAPRMRELNASHRGRDAVTDVLSFPIDGLDPLPEGLERQLGDVVICPAQVARQAAESGVEPGLELTTMLVHGLLHLVGHDHERDAGEMLALQDALVARLERLRLPATEPAA